MKPVGSSSSKTVFSSFEHGVYRRLRDLQLVPKIWILGVSGGRDSMLLLNVLKKITPALDVRLIVSHIHHGRCEGEQGQYRDQALSFVREKAMEFGLELVSNALPDPAKVTELECRELRLGQWRKLQDVFSEPSLIVCAHHAEDLLESRMLQLMRGTGAKGLEAMALYRDQILRPLLPEAQKDLKAYVEQEKVEFIEDPSNASAEPLRNWLRNEWLPQLEKKRPGALKAMSRSLELVVGELSTKEEFQFGTAGVERNRLLEVGVDERRQMLAHYLRQVGVSSFSAGQVNEILRRLDNGQNEYTFSLLKHRWTVNAEHIKASPLEGQH